MQDPHPAAGWWGYAEVDRTVVGILVFLVVVGAVVFFARRLWKR